MSLSSRTFSIFRTPGNGILVDGFDGDICLSQVGIPFEIIKKCHHSIVLPVLSPPFISLPHQGLTGLQNFTRIYQLPFGRFLGTLILLHPLESSTSNDFTSNKPPLSQISFPISHLPVKRTSFVIFLIQVLPSSFLSLFLFSSSFLHITLLL